MDYKIQSSLERLDLLEILSSMAEYGDHNTEEHTGRIAMLTQLVALKLDFNIEQANLMAAAARLHDIGKIAVPANILLKPGKLSQIERYIMQSHCQLGSDLLTKGKSPLFKLAARIAMSHHEHWDGLGYPNAVSAEDIPVEARIVALADVYDALTHTRPFRQQWSVEDAVSHIAVQREHHFDPVVADAFFDVLDDQGLFPR